MQEPGVSGHDHRGTAHDLDEDSEAALATVTPQHGTAVQDLVSEVVLAGTRTNDDPQPIGDKSGGELTMAGGRPALEGGEGAGAGDETDDGGTVSGRVRFEELIGGPGFFRAGGEERAGRGGGLSTHEPGHELLSLIRAVKVTVEGDAFPSREPAQLAGAGGGEADLAPTAGEQELRRALGVPMQVEDGIVPPAT
jgi:hypothetical protein